MIIATHFIISITITSSLRHVSVSDLVLYSANDKISFLRPSASVSTPSQLLTIQNRIRRLPRNSESISNLDELLVMWSETVGLRTRPVWDQKIGLGLGLAGFVLCCEAQSSHARRQSDLGGHSSFSSTICSFSIFLLETSLLWRSTVAFNYYLNIKSAKCLCLLPVVLVLRIWSCLHHCELHPWHMHCREEMFLEKVQVHPRNPSILGNDDLNHKCKILS